MSLLSLGGAWIISAYYSCLVFRPFDVVFERNWYSWFHELKGIRPSFCRGGWQRQWRWWLPLVSFKWRHISVTSVTLLKINVSNLSVKEMDDRSDIPPKKND